MRFFRQEHWSGLPCPPPGDLEDPGPNSHLPAFPALQANSLPTESPGKLRDYMQGRIEDEFVGGKWVKRFTSCLFMANTSHNIPNSSVSLCPHQTR